MQDLTFLQNLALVMMAVVLPSAALWAAGGEAMGRLIVGHGAATTCN